jgi:hypothetical protein
MRFAFAMAAILAACAALGLFFVGCGSSSSSASDCNSGGGGGGTCTPGVTPAYTSCVDLTTPTVSFSRDIQPIFVGSCAAEGSSCHGAPTTDVETTGQEFLGYPDGGDYDAAGILSALVGKPSPENTTMDLIEPGAPDASYMMHKLDDDQCQYATICDATKNSVFAECGYGMPFGKPILPQATRDLIRQWIAQGAQNN